jgi:hypothetical protein
MHAAIQPLAYAVAETRAWLEAAAEHGRRVERLGAERG